MPLLYTPLTPPPITPRAPPPPPCPSSTPPRPTPRHPSTPPHAPPLHPLDPPPPRHPSTPPHSLPPAPPARRCSRRHDVQWSSASPSTTSWCGDGKNELQETALSYVKDAERDLAEAKEKADLAREALLAAKGALREEQEKPAQQRPGIDVDYEDIIEVLWKDVHKKVRNSGKWPFVVDPTLKTQTFLRYRDIVYINVLASREMEEERLRMHILGALRYGKPLVFDMMDVDMVKEMREKINQVPWAGLGGGGCRGSLCVLLSCGGGGGAAQGGHFL